MKKATPKISPYIKQKYTILEQKDNLNLHVKKPKLFRVTYDLSGKENTDLILKSFPLDKKYIKQYDFDLGFSKNHSDKNVKKIHQLLITSSNVKKMFFLVLDDVFSNYGSAKVLEEIIYSFKSLKRITNLNLVFSTHFRTEDKIVAKFISILPRLIQLRDFNLDIQRKRVPDYLLNLISKKIEQSKFIRTFALKLFGSELSESEILSFSNSLK